VSGDTDSCKQASRFRISLADELADELRRVGRSEIDQAVDQARRIPQDPSRSVHECRKAIKRLRALAQFGRGRKGARWQRADRILRDAGRVLAEARDADVLTRTAAELGHEEDPGAPREHALALDGAFPAAGVSEAVTELLGRAQVELEALFADQDWRISHLCKGVDQGYGRTRRNLHRFRRHRRESDAHDWRKGVQRYANQLRVLETFLPAGTEDRLAELDDLAGCLGVFQDLTVLRAAVESGWARAGQKATHRLVESAKARQRKLRKHAVDLGLKLFDEDRCPLVREGYLTI
jgi:CHAD domain-containing protein